MEHDEYKPKASAEVRTRYHIVLVTKLPQTRSRGNRRRRARQHPARHDHQRNSQPNQTTHHT